MDRKELEVKLRAAGESAARPGETFKTVINQFGDGTTELGIEYYKGGSLTGHPTVRGLDILKTLENLTPMLAAHALANGDEEEDEEDW